MTRPEVTARDLLSQRVRHVLRDRNVREVAMFGGRSYLVDDRMAVAVQRTGDLLVRTDPDDYDALLDRGAEPARMGNDRTMGRGWLSVRADLIAGDAELAHWIEVGVASRSTRA